jgi:hypothetical protein
MAGARSVPSVLSLSEAAPNGSADDVSAGSPLVPGWGSSGSGGEA